ncbi:MAG: MFS transporter, partial [Candidatus Dadabacteria bacterium]|nr:MFS transporter [Candidatus Dadabacteria bacterium]NIX15539.1 MFS transporter [Candidatus Dadabacteria bacterium]NIY22279.1 MFS transporter [Candidatus Dadabacteria bacterium]
FATETTAGIAFGIYAISQSLLQIPFGWASDRFGRKRVLIFGIIVFIVGSILCGFAGNIHELIFARVLQGSGAISSVAISSLGDITRPEVRAQSFTITGIIIGFTFVVGMLLGPLLASSLGFSSLFFILAILGVVAILATLIYFPDIEIKERVLDKSRLYNYLRNKDIKTLFVSTFINALTTNIFLFIFPLTWLVLGETSGNIWQAYLIILVPSFLIVFPYIRRAEKNKNLKISTSVAWVLLLVCFTAYLFMDSSKSLLLFIGVVFFIGHTIFQSLLPAFLTQRIPSEYRGVSTGFYNLCSFFGAGVGGIIAGYLYELNAIYPIIFILSFLALWRLIGL